METTIKIIVLLLTSLTLYSCGGGCDDQQPLSQSTGSLTIKRASSNDELERYLKASLVNNYATEVHRPVYMLASADSAEASVSGAAQTFSTTNTQESDVDEADRLKTNGDVIFTSSINAPEINIFSAQPGAPALATYPVDTLNDAKLSGLYLRSNANQLIALSGDSPQNFPLWDNWFMPSHWANRKTEVFSLDVAVPTAPELQRKLTLDGQLISSRRIGSTLYLATRHTPSIDGLTEYPEDERVLRTNRDLINAESLAEMMPHYQINGGSEQSLFSVEDCFVSDYQHPKQQQSSIIGLIAVDLNDATLTPRGQCYVGDAETIYASSKAIYLATTHVAYDDKSSTELHKFSLDGAVPNYRGTGSVSGHLGWQQDLKPFRMSEHNDVLRIVTYTGDQSDSDHSPATLYTLRENTATASLDILGSLPNETHPTPLGKPGEQIYATRFIADKAYLVTFRTTDPLYIVDLTDPANPFMASELEINGYSDYLHPVGENYLLGIGKDAVAANQTENSSDVMGDGRGAWVQGVKLSLIDISDASAPYEKQQIILGKRGSDTAASRTHHALTSLLRGDILEIALPLTIHDTPFFDDMPDSPSQYYQWTKDTLYRLSINTNTGEIQTLADIDSERRRDDPMYYYSQEWQHDRSAIIDDTVYYLQGDKVISN